MILPPDMRDKLDRAMRRTLSDDARRETVGRDAQPARASGNGLRRPLGGRPDFIAQYLAVL